MTLLHRLLKRWRGPRAKYIPKRPHMELAQVLIWAASKQRKNWCIFSIAAISKTTAKMYGLRRCKNSIINHLNALERQGYIKRIRRVTRERIEKHQDMRTIYVLQPKLLWWAHHHFKQALQWLGGSWAPPSADAELVGRAREKAEAAGAGVKLPPIVQNIRDRWRDLFRSLLPAAP